MLCRISNSGIFLEHLLQKVDAWNVYCELVKHLDGVFCFKFIFPSENNKIDALSLESKSAKKFLNPLLTNGYRGNSKRVS